MEISGPGMKYVHPDAVAAKFIIDAVRAKLEGEIGNIEGVLIEKKKFSFTLHYRMTNKDRCERLCEKPSTKSYRKMPKSNA